MDPTVRPTYCYCKHCARYYTVFSARRPPFVCPSCLNKFSAHRTLDQVRQLCDEMRREPVTCEGNLHVIFCRTPKTLLHDFWLQKGETHKQPALACLRAIFSLVKGMEKRTEGATRRKPRVKYRTPRLALMYEIALAFQISERFRYRKIWEHGARPYVQCATCAKATYPVYLHNGGCVDCQPSVPRLRDIKDVLQDE